WSGCAMPNRNASFAERCKMNKQSWSRFEASTSTPYGFSVVGTSRCDVPARVQRAERISQDERTTADVAPLDAARQAQRAVPTTLNPHLTPVGGVGVRVGAAILIGALALSTVRADSLWHDGQSRPMVGDKRAVGVGDILHILVEESNSTT